MISIRNGKYQYGDFALAIDFTIAANSIAAVVGPSGAGKSTLLSLIAGFENLTSGVIELAGTEATHAAPAARPISMIFQDHNAFPHLSAFDNVALGVSPSLSLTPEQRTNIERALDHVGLTTLTHRKPGEMSGGERQRVALARVLVRDKPILLLDEAFAALGPALRKEMLTLVKSLANEKKLTVMMVTHDPQDAVAIADQVMFVDAGEVRAPVSTQKFFAERDEAVQSYLG